MADLPVDLHAAFGSAVFFALAPGTVIGLVPWLITGWMVSPGWPWPPLVLGTDAT